MFYRILAYDLLSDFARGSRRKFRIRLIGGDLGWGAHFSFSPVRIKMKRAAGRGA
jgi:hypothetical protein